MWGLGRPDYTHKQRAARGRRRALGHTCSPTRDGATPVTSLYFETTPAVRRGRRPSRVYTYIYVTIPRRSTGGGAHNHEASLSTASNGHRRHGAPAPPRRAAGDRFSERPLGLMRHRAQPPLLAAAERRLRAARGARIGSDRVSMHGRQPAPKAPWGAPRSASPWEAVPSASPRPLVHAPGSDAVAPAAQATTAPSITAPSWRLSVIGRSSTSCSRESCAFASRRCGRLPTRAAGAARAEAQPRGPEGAGSPCMSMSQAALYRSMKQPLLAARCTPREGCRRRHHNAARLRRR